MLASYRSELTSNVSALLEKVYTHSLTKIKLNLKDVETFVVRYNLQAFIVRKEYRHI